MSEQIDPILEKLTTDPTQLTSEEMAAGGLTVEVERTAPSEQPSDVGTATGLTDIEAQLGRPLNETEREVLARKTRVAHALKEHSESSGSSLFAATLPEVSGIKGKSNTGQWIATLDYNGTLGGGQPRKPLQVPGIINRTPKN